MLMNINQLLVIILSATHLLAHGMEESPRLISCTKIDYKFNNSKIINMSPMQNGELNLYTNLKVQNNLILNYLGTHVDKTYTNHSFATSQNGRYSLCWDSLKGQSYVDINNHKIYLNHRSNFMPNGIVNNYGDIIIKFSSELYRFNFGNCSPSSTLTIEGGHACEAVAFGNSNQKLLACIFIPKRDSRVLALWDMWDDKETVSPIKLRYPITQTKKLQLTNDDTKACVLYDVYNSQDIAIVNLLNKEIESIIPLNTQWIWHTFCLGKNTAKNEEILQIYAKKKNEEDNIYIISYALKYNVLFDKVRSKFNNIYFSFDKNLSKN